MHSLCTDIVEDEHSAQRSF